MPHLTIEYTANLEASADMGMLCTTLAATLVALRHDDGAPLFPVIGTRDHCRGATRRDQQVQVNKGPVRLASVKTHLAPVFAAHAVGLTLQVHEGVPVYEGKHNNLAAHLAPA